MYYRGRIHQRAHKAPRIWEVKNQSKILRHQLERFVSGLELRLQSARRGKAGVSDILGVASRFLVHKNVREGCKSGRQKHHLGFKHPLVLPRTFSD